MTTEAKGYKYPFPTPDFARQIADTNIPPLFGTISGEIAANSVQNLGVARFPGKVTGVIGAVSTAGKDDSDAPKVTFDVRINGVTVFDTKPAIAHVSGEVVQHKTTHSEAGDTGITEGVLIDDPLFSAGDLLQWEAIYSGAGSPTVKMANPSILVEVEPVI